MKRTSPWILIFLVLISFISCDNLKESVDRLLTFTITDETSITIQSASPLNLPIDIPTPDITTNSNQEFENNDTRAELVKDIRLQRIQLTIANPSTKTFSFLKSIRLYISTNNNDEMELAFKENINTNEPQIDLEVTDQKLDNYVKSSSYRIRTKVVTREALTQDIDVMVALAFKVTATAR